MMTKTHLRNPMPGANGCPGIREICAHLELDRRRQDRLPDEPEPWARSGPPTFLMPSLPTSRHGQQEPRGPPTHSRTGPAAFVIPGTVHARTKTWSLQ